MGSGKDGGGSSTITSARLASQTADQGYSHEATRRKGARGGEEEEGRQSCWESVSLPRGTARSGAEIGGENGKGMEL